MVYNISMYKNKLAASKPIEINDLTGFTNTRYLIINLCMVITYELSKMGTHQQQIIHTFSRLVIKKDCLNKSPIIKKSIPYINENYMNRITLKEVAQRVNLNPSYFSYAFKTEMNITFSAYLNNVRIHHSEYLIKNTNYSIQNIALGVGSQSQHYFSKIFKELMGISPSAYRKRFSNHKKL